MAVVPPVTPLFLWSRLSPWISLAPGTVPEGPFTVLRARGSDSPYAPVPRAAPCWQESGSGKGTGVEEVTDEPLYRDRVCGIDIGKAEMYATIRVPSGRDPARRASETRGFATTRRGVLALADWLRCRQVPAVVTEATGDYRKPATFLSTSTTRTGRYSGRRMGMALFECLQQ